LRQGCERGLDGRFAAAQHRLKDVAQGRAIAGLYAAGACAWNIAQDTRGYSSGTCLGESTYFGRRAGGHAARSALGGG